MPTRKTKAATHYTFGANMASVTSKILFAVAAVAGLCLVYSQTAFAGPMRCSGEQKACISNCNNTPNRASISVCITNCGARQAMCIKTGCWDNGTQKYCGLARQ